jgi:hypothetical protein
MSPYPKWLHTLIWRAIGVLLVLVLLGLIAWACILIAAIAYELALILAGAK